jgi:lipopolysaccharide transport system permease protein
VRNHQIGHSLRIELNCLWTNRGLLLLMARRELESRYAGSVIGLMWAYVQPVLTVAAYFLVFDLVFSMRMGAEAPTSRVGTYLIVGSLPWLSFCESLSRGMASLLDAGGMLQKTALPPVLFVARSVIAGWAVFVPLMVFLAMVYLAVGGIGWFLLALPVLMILQLLLAFLLAYVLAILAAALRDTTQVLTFVLSIGIFMSPVLFPINLFPEGWRWVLYLNPMTPLVLGYQSIMLQGKWPEPRIWMVALIWMLVLAWLLSTLLKRSREEIIDWL